jgi:putative membrane protein
VDITALLAEVNRTSGDWPGWYGPHMDGGWMWPAMIMSTVLLIALALAVGWALAHPVRHDPSGRRNDARDILDERLAKGELDTDEYRARREALG